MVMKYDEKGLEERLNIPNKLTCIHHNRFLVHVDALHNEKSIRFIKKIPMRTFRVGQLIAVVYYWYVSIFEVYSTNKIKKLAL